jgi:predicted AAA+ superfamily ATPase
VAFFQRTYITEGMRLLLIQVAQRLNGGAASR